MKNIKSLLTSDLNKDLVDLFPKKKEMTVSGAGSYSSKVYIISDILRNYKNINKILWIVNDFTEQENVLKSFKLWDEIPVYSFNLSEENENGENDYLKLLELISHLRSSEKELIIVNYRDLMLKVPEREKVEKNIITINSKEKHNITDIFEALISAGYCVSEDSFLEKGKYLRHGGNLDIFPINCNYPIRIEADFDELGDIVQYEDAERKKLKKINKIEILPINIEEEGEFLLSYLSKDSLIIDDELEVFEDLFLTWKEILTLAPENSKKITFTPFYEDNDNHVNLSYASVIGYPNVFDLINDISEKKKLGWHVVCFTKRFDELAAIFKDRNVNFVDNEEDFYEKKYPYIVKVEAEDIMPHAFQSPKYKFIIITDKEIESLKERYRKVGGASHKVYLDLLTSLKLNDYVVHSDHGIAIFQGLSKKTVDNLTREYLQLAYAENDKLFVPIDQADKVSKYIGTGDSEPKLTRLGSAEWSTIQSKVRKETEKIAKELLAIYAKRELAKGYKFKEDNALQEKFEKTFPYEPTPGQLKAIMDVKRDMEKEKAMDRLVCGDVGFGKTEVAMRASFKSVLEGKQVAFISPITILADQHYRSFKERMDSFHIRVEMLSRFKSKKEQKEIIKLLSKGEMDIVIGTHRLLQPDVKFKNLGLVIIDEEQRFGVKQKEQFKDMRSEVDILTMTATPIPRTLNIALNKLKDISTITTPPRGRLPVMVEVRRYSNELIREVILREKERKGQVYFLHNRVQTIDSVARSLEVLIPEAKFIVAHGKLGSGDLEQRIIDFKDGKYDVLVSSTIIENGIDLPNANTLIVNNAEKFGLAQLYQLRGRVGRGEKQAYAYFLYQSQRLKYDAKKRLRSIVEATELGSGFQIAMKDLEIRGAGDILGANQHGAINVVGVSHFIRMLNQAVEDMKAGKTSQGEEIQDVSIELPLTSYIPDYYISNTKEKIQVYQKLSGADTFSYLDELKEELVEDYGKMPREVNNLFRVLELKILAKAAGIINVKAENIHDQNQRMIILHMSDKVKPENIFNLMEHNANWLISETKLKIKTKDLSVQWFDELKECLVRLGKNKVEKKVVNA
ncbi:transcription-repair coupling factor [Candidatus Peregrinibacteria bacterium RIFOXYA2_FULL_33_7]|nr:MAG: transcription-repair coupling factor [Candidatus Peregrinibacteria bacterium RIFOXYA2_FULL_33_7]